MNLDVIYQPYTPASQENLGNCALCADCLDNGQELVAHTCGSKNIREDNREETRKKIHTLFHPIHKQCVLYSIDSFPHCLECESPASIELNFKQKAIKELKLMGRDMAIAPLELTISAVALPFLLIFYPCIQDYQLVTWRRVNEMGGLLLGMIGGAMMLGYSDALENKDVCREFSAIEQCTLIATSLVGMMIMAAMGGYLDRNPEK